MQTVYRKDTGEAFKRDAVDCREMLASGMYQEAPVSEEELNLGQDDGEDLTKDAGTPWAANSENPADTGKPASKGTSAKKAGK